MLINRKSKIGDSLLGNELTYKPEEMVYADEFDDNRWSECIRTLDVWPIGGRRKNEEEVDDNA